MTRNTRAKRKRANDIVNYENDDPKSSKSHELDSPSSEIFDPSYVEEELRDIEAEVEERCREIQNAADHWKKQFCLIMAQQNVQIPTKIKKMTIREFKSKFGGAAFRKDAGAKLKNVPQSAVKPVLANNRNMAKTPRFRPDLPCTPRVRQARMGESILSVNGSPLAMQQSALKNGTAQKKGASTPGGIKICLEGNDINFKSPTTKANVKSNPEMQKRLLEVQNEISQMLAQAGISMS